MMLSDDDSWSWALADFTEPLGAFPLAGGASETIDVCLRAWPQSANTLKRSFDSSPPRCATFSAANLIAMRVTSARDPILTRRASQRRTPHSIYNRFVSHSRQEQPARWPDANNVGRQIIFVTGYETKIEGRLRLPSAAFGNVALPPFRRHSAPHRK